MDEETWLIDTSGKVFSFNGNHLAKAFGGNLNDEEAYLVVQDFKPVGAVIKEDHQIHYSKWDTMAKDHSEMSLSAFRSKLLALSNDGFRQTFQAPNGTMINANEVDHLFSLKISDRHDQSPSIKLRQTDYKRSA